MNTLQSDISGSGRRVAIVVSRFNHSLSHRLLEGCEATLRAKGCNEIDVVWVPGAFEIPLAARACADTGRYQAIVALGVVVRGGTPHFDYVCRGVTDGVRDINVETKVPVAFGVLTTDNVEQALERAAREGEAGSNKGSEAAEVALEMAGLLKLIEKAR